MKSLGLDSNNDLILSGGFFKVVENGAYVTQDVRSRLLFYKAEWFLNVFVGVPWLQEVFIKPSNLNNIESILKTKIIETNNIEKLTQFSMNLKNRDSRKLEISFSAETSFGIIEGVTINV